MAQSFIVPRSTAIKNRTGHQFLPGIGYVAHAQPPECPAHPRGGKNCAPAAGTKDGTTHVMRPPNGARDMHMVWVAGENAWGSNRHDRGNRLAWSVAHLSRAGWEYVGPAKPGETDPSMPVDRPEMAPAPAS